MEDDDTIGTIEGVATFERVAVSSNGRSVKVFGDYGDNKTTYQTDIDNVFIGGMSLDLIHDEFWLRPKRGDYLYVKATEQELRITEDKPEE